MHLRCYFTTVSPSDTQRLEVFNDLRGKDISLAYWVWECCPKWPLACQILSCPLHHHLNTSAWGLLKAPPVNYHHSVLGPNPLISPQNKTRQTSLATIRKHSCNWTSLLSRRTRQQIGPLPRPQSPNPVLTSPCSVSIHPQWSAMFTLQYPVISLAPIVALHDPRHHRPLVWLLQLAWLPACCGFGGPREGGLLCGSELLWSLGREQRIQQARRAESSEGEGDGGREGRLEGGRVGGYRRSGLSLAPVMWLVGSAAWRNGSSQSSPPRFPLQHPHRAPHTAIQPPPPSLHRKWLYMAPITLITPDNTSSTK